MFGPWPVARDPESTSDEYITFKRRGERGVCSLATLMSCIDASVRIVTKSPKEGPLLIFSISLQGQGDGAERGEMLDVQLG
jgi:hypothetical protein